MPIAIVESIHTFNLLLASLLFICSHFTGGDKKEKGDLLSRKAKLYKTHQNGISCYFGLSLCFQEMMIG